MQFTVSEVRKHDEKLIKKPREKLISAAFQHIFMWLRQGKDTFTEQGRGPKPAHFTLVTVP